MPGTKSPSSKYLRITFVLGDRDPDLKAWCRDNSKVCGAVLRLALREYLAGHPDAGAEAPATARRRTKPVNPPSSLEPLAAAALPRRETAPPPAPVPPPRPAQTAPPAELPHSESDHEATTTVTPTVSSDAKVKLRRMFSANRDFA